ncbi:MAG: MerR family transcriptional regulator [Candidatus Omnitrophota bacterium]|nr:MAG: MerR family transcriptional regulator [Candidatus Omnitrophota bacterium]
MNPQERLLSPKELAKILRVSAATINYYTNMGLFKPTDRKGNLRLYNRRETVGIFEKIQQLRREGYSLRLIQQRLEKGYSV